MKRFVSILALAFLVVSCQSAPLSQAPVTLEQIQSMGKDQIQALSPEQMDAAFAEAERNLAALSVPPSLVPLALWPNYAQTLYVATGINYETYLSGYYKGYSGPDWSDDGCSGPTPPVIFDGNACRQHDFGYRNVAQYAAGRNETVRKSIDERFLSNMRLRCDRRWSAWYQYALKQACKVDALAFYGAVRNFGEDAFYNTRQRY